MLLVLAEVGATVCHEHVELLEAALVKQLGDSLARCVLASLVLFLDGFLAAAQTRLGALLYEFLDFFLLNAHFI